MRKVAAVLWLCLIVGCGRGAGSNPPVDAPDTTVEEVRPEPSSPDSAELDLDPDADVADAGRTHADAGSAADSGATAPASALDGDGNFEWVVTDSRAPQQMIIATATDAQGFIYALKLYDTQRPGWAVTSAGEISKYRADGSLVFARQFPLNSTWNTTRMAASPSGEVYFHVQVIACQGSPCEPADFGGGPVTEASLVKLNADGSFAWHRPLGPNLLTSLDVLADGSVLVLTNELQPRLIRIDADNQLVWEKAMPEATAAAFDPSGNVVLGVGFDETGGIQKLDPAGNVVWTTLFATRPYAFSSVRVRAVSATALGTVVAVANYSGDHSWGPTALPVVDQGPPPYDHPLNYESVLIAAESHGAPRFAVHNPGYFYDGLALDKAGRVYVGFDGLTKFNLEGTKLWQWSRAPIRGMAVTADHGVVLNGEFSKAFDFGGGTVDPAPAKTATFLLKLTR